ncbi:hypothetical protein PC128_g24040 [Phytophthora cactorum]|nr:hypothetical protein PC128_g24040 [Phytophthora cactorum]
MGKRVNVQRMEKERIELLKSGGSILSGASRKLRGS